MAGPEETAVNRNYATVYSRSFLSLFYDAYVLGFNMRFIWGCPTNSVLLPFFTSNFSRNHLDCGVATGWFLAKVLGSPFRKHSKQRLALLDINANPLRAAETRVQSLTTATTTQCVEADVTQPPPKALQIAKFDSISMLNLFHCMPGGADKFKALGTYKELLTDDGVLFGCTVLGARHSLSWVTTLYLRMYNHQFSVFNNWNDSREDIEEVLNNEFEEVETTLVGIILLFRATRPRKTPDNLLE